MKQHINFTVPTYREVIGTSFHWGMVKNNAIDISKALGRLSEGFDDGKTRFEWIRKFGSIVFTIYDYKDYPSEKDVIEYHIGTNSEEDTLMVIELLKKVGLNAYMFKG